MLAMDPLIGFIENSQGMGGVARKDSLSHLVLKKLLALMSQFLFQAVLNTTEIRTLT